MLCERRRLSATVLLARTQSSCQAPGRAIAEPRAMKMQLSLERALRHRRLFKSTCDWGSGGSCQCSIGGLGVPPSALLTTLIGMLTLASTLDRHEVVNPEPVDPSPGAQDAGLRFF